MSRIDLRKLWIMHTDIKALMKTCPNLTGLNIADTDITYATIHEVVAGLAGTLEYLSLPSGIGLNNLMMFEKEPGDVIPMKWNNVKIPKRLNEFKRTIDRLHNLKNLHVSNWRWDVKYYTLHPSGDLISTPNRSRQSPYNNITTYLSNTWDSQRADNTQITDGTSKEWYFDCQQSRQRKERIDIR